MDVSERLDDGLVSMMCTINSSLCIISFLFRINRCRYLFGHFLPSSFITFTSIVCSFFHSKFGFERWMLGNHVTIIASLYLWIGGLGLDRSQ